MLQNLRIKNFAIIEDQSIEFGSGLNILSGETGSGKSLILEAFRLVLGGRGTSDYFRAGTDGWQIEAVISLTDIDPVIKEKLPDIVKEAEDLVVSRSMSTQGRSKVMINGNLASLTLLQEVTPYVIALCTQGAQLELTSAEYQLHLLDEYGSLSNQVADCQAVYRDFVKSEAELKDLRTKRESALMRQAELEFIVNELSDLQPYDGMRITLEEKIKDIKGARENRERLEAARDLILNERGILSQINNCAAQIKKVPLLAEKVADNIERLLDEAGLLERELYASLKSLDSDSGELETLQEQLAELARLERKFKTDDRGLALLLAKAMDEQGAMVSTQSENELVEKVNALKTEVTLKAEGLSKSRKKVARQLEKLLAKELEELEMRSAEIKVDFKSVEICSNGLDAVEFIFSPNPGEQGKPLRQIASGGELSRVMLILKKLLRDRSGVNILVFDEVDTGISGAVAEAVGRKLKDISGFSQVVCITHLPQVASFSDRHFLIQKEVIGGARKNSKEEAERTKTTVSLLSQEEKIEEIARMLAGYKVTAAARASAIELLSSKDMVA